MRVHTGHTDGKSNPSDEDSRVQVGWTEWQLNLGLFQMMEVEWGPFGLDAFATEWDNQTTSCRGITPSIITMGELWDWMQCCSSYHRSKR